MHNFSKLFFLSTLFSLPAVSGESITYEVDDAEYEGYWSKIDDNAPLILMLHDWDGLTEYEVKRTKMLNKLGYNVFAIDLFGKGIRPTEIQDKKQHTGELYKDRQKLRKLLQAGAMEAKNQGGNLENNVMIGYCFGGAAVLEAARAALPSKAYVSFHGGLSTPAGQDYSKTQSPIIVFHGSADSMIPMEQFANLTNQLESHKVTHEMITYSGAPHAFTVFGSEKYQIEADKKSWMRLTQILNSVTQ
ncbi:dienelactone hydrolase family protein [Photobacterium angustum]|uniref:dienelactone hydrolase family protein n=1 Tax=Photobacterium angustum TaxID=661 RepID=UPI0005E20E93|nr:dienelactone hydrolase family protein [Photobacterium angustum]KJF95172.1 dienelactone hydrolase [Photobacterium angustum]KJG01415.1 dienelactone hydrolase [Photobacterium angustum]KJG16408.1 dienelactone hydrolase [Photobacterium angustum]KJG22457.1 dienelactone hydrolase [Photobacterium angustum]KJG28861.1 dienelactone hydrolase [Photobacterium angustum]